MPEARVPHSSGGSASALHLLAPKWRMALHRMRQNKRGDFRRSFVISLLAMAFWAASFSIAFKLLRNILISKRDTEIEIVFINLDIACKQILL